MKFFYLIVALLLLAGCVKNTDDEAETTETTAESTWVVGVVIEEQLLGTGDGVIWVAVVEVEGHRVGITSTWCGDGAMALSKSSARLHAMAPVGTRIHFDPGDDAAVCPDELSILEEPDATMP